MAKPLARRGPHARYDRLKHRLERLMELGHADAVVESDASSSSGDGSGWQSHDEGETAMQAAECLPVVFNACKVQLTGRKRYCLPLTPA